MEYPNNPHNVPSQNDRIKPARPTPINNNDHIYYICQNANARNVRDVRQPNDRRLIE